MRDFLRVLLRIAAVTGIESLALFVMARLVPGITLGGSTADQALAAVSAAVVLGLLNALVRPLIFLSGLPINLYTVGLFTLVLNAGILLLSAYFLPNFIVAGLPAALTGSLVLSLLNTFITGLVSIDQDYAYYDGVVRWLGRRNIGADTSAPTRGLVFLEIDGLSYQRASRAMQEGLLPAMKKLLDGGTHVLSHFDCGLPSQSSSCQAGIMYGDNFDIPGFRWYIKSEGRLVVSNRVSDAQEINQRFFNGRGLLRQGTSINNLLSGEAERSLLTISTLGANPEAGTAQAASDLSLVFLNPYLLTRAVVLTVWDLILEFYQALSQRLRNVRPRVNRLNRFYPFLRAGLNVFLRDVAANGVILDVMRGSPAIYMTFMGYDEIAHHAGPDTADALQSLKGFDRSLSRILDVIARKAPRPYEVYILSDHGQSFGATFCQRSGQTLAQFMDDIIGGKSYAAEGSDAEKARSQVSALLTEMEGLRGRGGHGQTRAEVLSRAGRRLNRRLNAAEAQVPVDTDMLVLPGGNLANIYFPQYPGKLTAAELERLYPELLESLVAQPDIGLIVTYTEDGRAWVIGKPGARSLAGDGQSGSRDPLAAYGDPVVRAQQLRRLAEFPNAGDLILISTVYGEGQVAAFEDQVGSHGGLGGQQTDAFILHPLDVSIACTSNSLDLYPILNGRRDGKPEYALPPASPGLQGAWTWPLMREGIANLQQMMGRAARSLRLDRSLFVEVAADARATGQALLIALLLCCGTLLFALLAGSGRAAGVSGQFSAAVVLLLGLALCLLSATAAGRLRGRSYSFTRSFNALSYAGIGGFVAWFAPLDHIGPLLLITGTLIVLVASWLAIQEALVISRWPAVLIPLISFTIAAAVLAAVNRAPATALLALTGWF